ncbi:sigma 54-interacting transcriptional regulator [Syntrophomonas erecta]
MRYTDLELLPAVIVHITDPLQACIQTMQERKSSFLVVYAGTHPIGFITLNKALLCLQNSQYIIPVSEVCDRNLLCVQLNDELDYFINSSAGLAVVYEKEHMIGIISKDNAAKHIYSYLKKLDVIIEASFDSLFVTDGQGQVLRVNEAYARTTGIPLEEIVGRNMRDLVQEGYYDRSATLDVLATGKPVTFTQTLKSGKTLLVTGNPIFNNAGQIVQVLTNGRDITELNRLRQEVEHVMELNLHYQRELQRVQYENSTDYVFESEKIKSLLDVVGRLSQVESSVLILGESGVGKEVIAHALHRLGPRSDKPFIKINCAAIPDNLMESELFGYEGGAFTGAKKEGKRGFFELANHGTLFLDEIGELPYILQAKLLQVLQDGEIIRVGGIQTIPIDVRLITATNRNIWDMIEQKRFRGDLYYRLSVVPIYVPPLRERREDIPPLVQHFVQMFNKKYGFNKEIHPQLIGRLIHYHWPGNIRELKNVIERLIVTSPEEVIETFPDFLFLPQQHSQNTTDLSIYINSDLKTMVQDFEKRILKQYIEVHCTSRKVARALGISQTSAVRKAHKYGLCFK